MKETSVSLAEQYVVTLSSEAPTKHKPRNEHVKIRGAQTDLIEHLNKHCFTATAPPRQSHRDSPTATAPPRQPHRDSPTSTVPPRQPHRVSPTATAAPPRQQPHRHSNPFQAAKLREPITEDWLALYSSLVIIGACRCQLTQRGSSLEL